MSECHAAPDEEWPVRIVSLEDAHARRCHIASQLDTLDIPFRFLNAVDGRNGLAVGLEGLVDRDGTVKDFGRNLTDPEYGCALSHMSIYQEIVDENLPGAIVLEDDAIVSSAFKDFVSSRAYEIADLIQLDHLHGDIWKFETRRKLMPGFSIVPAARNASLTTGYSISRRGAEYLLRNGLPLRGPADWPCDVTALPAMLALPRIVDHPDEKTSYSTIAAERERLVLAKPKTKRALRFFSKSYWQRWVFKRRTKRIS